MEYSVNVLSRLSDRVLVRTTTSVERSVTTETGTLVSTVVEVEVIVSVA